MSSRGGRFGWDRFREVDLFAHRHETNAKTLSQAIRAAASEEPDADGSVLFGQLRCTMIRVMSYEKEVSISRDHLGHSGALIRTVDPVRWNNHAVMLTC